MITDDFCDTSTLGKSTNVSYQVRELLSNILSLITYTLILIIQKNKKYEIMKNFVAGYAYVAGACDRNATKHSSEAVGIVEDKGGFDGIIPTAHEIGHLIGARHDGNPKGAADCPPFDGFIMTSGLMLHENGFEWSSCSINAFHDFIKYAYIG